MTTGERPLLALATCAAYPDLTPDDGDLIAALETHGWRTSALIWNDPAVDWSLAAGVLVRSTWDYHLHHGQFTAWLDRLDRQGIPVLNPTAAIRANLDKRYLRDLADQGIPIVPTRFVDPGPVVPDLATVMDRLAWGEVVIKPLVSGGAHRTWRVRRAEADAFQAELAETVQSTGAMIQAFAPEILADGEWSLIFIGGEYSHAVIKRPKTGDFRVQDIHGGTITVATPAKALQVQAATLLAHMAAPLPYARVDGIARDGTLWLMEVELIEPNLFLRHAPGSAARLASAVTAALS
ncbi:MAG: hypothetical protein H7338_24385 [Candidatus Sericytochromatia bacterium]|nr:hypothetical protein [Candidatus Sericytochromatia bacterium]